jgi:hypothetical protein
MGLAVLAGAPLVATVLTSSVPARLAGAATIRAQAVEVAERSLTPRLLLRLHAPFTTPTPRPSPPPTHPPRRAKPARTTHVTIPAAIWPHTAVVADIVAAANRWGVDPNWMLRIAACESGLRPNAYNPRGPYYGLFQFLMSTFLHNGGHNIWDPADQANVAAKMLAHGQAHQWGCA